MGICYEQENYDAYNMWSGKCKALFYALKVLEM